MSMLKHRVNAAVAPQAVAYQELALADQVSKAPEQDRKTLQKELGRWIFRDIDDSMAQKAGEARLKFSKDEITLEQWLEVVKDVESQVGPGQSNALSRYRQAMASAGEGNQEAYLAGTMDAKLLLREHANAGNLSLAGVSYVLRQQQNDFSFGDFYQRWSSVLRKDNLDKPDYNSAVELMEVGVMINASMMEPDGVMGDKIERLSKNPDIDRSAVKEILDVLGRGSEKLLKMTDDLNAVNPDSSQVERAYDAVDYMRDAIYHNRRNHPSLSQNKGFENSL